MAVRFMTESGAYIDVGSVAAGTLVRTVDPGTGGSRRVVLNVPYAVGLEYVRRSKVWKVTCEVELSGP